MINNLLPVFVRIRAALMRRGRSAHDAEDLVQEAWVRLVCYERDQVVDTWQDVAGVTLSSYASAASSGAAPDANRAGPLKPRRWALAATALAVLQDGTRMSMNTATRVRVEFARAQRTVKVEGGEALFEVAKDMRRPFVVQAAGTEVVSTGTAFVVRLTPASEGAGDVLAVTLVEGQVVVRAADTAAGAALSNPVVMAAGDRVRLRQLGGVARASRTKRCR